MQITHGTDNETYYMQRSLVKCIKDGFNEMPVNQDSVNKLQSLVEYMQKQSFPLPWIPWTPNATEEAEIGEQDMIYFRVSNRQTPEETEIEGGLYACNWFAISLRRLEEAKFNVVRYLTPVFREPCCPFDDQHEPLVVGCYIFIIAPATHIKNSLRGAPERSIRVRRVQYIDTGDKKKKWRSGPSLRGAPERLYMFASDDKIYAVGLDGEIPFSLHYLDCHKLEKGWKFYRGGCCNPRHGYDFIFGHKIEDVFVNGSARKQLIILKSGHQIVCSLDTNKDTNEDTDENTIEWKVFEVNIDRDTVDYIIPCSVCHNDWMYTFAPNYKSKKIELKVYSIKESKMCPNTVIGFEKYDNALPNFRNLSPKFLHLGEGCFFFFWAEGEVSPIRVRCTKFNINVIDGQHYAEKVSTHEYKVEGALGYATTCEFNVLIRRYDVIGQFLNGSSMPGTLSLAEEQN